MPDDTHGLDTRAVRAHLREERRDLVTTVADCADAVAADWDGTRTTDAADVTGPLRATLDRAGVLARFPSVLRECVAAAGGSLQADPVAAPPYVVVTSVGPLLRATLADDRLVVTLRVFEVERTDDGPPRYVRTERDPEAITDVEVR
ncbi:MAG: hypothetical protein ABEJ05_11980 [Haloglomus sp.]